MIFDNAISEGFSKHGELMVVEKKKPIYFDDMNNPPFGIAKVSNGSISLYLYTDNPKYPRKFIKTYNNRELILIEPLMNEICGMKLAIHSNQYSTISVMSYVDFRESVLSNNFLIEPIMKGIIKSTARLLNRYIISSELKGCDRYILAIYGRISSDELLFDKMRTGRPSGTYDKVRLTRVEAASETGMGERTVRRVHQEFVKKGLIKESVGKGFVMVDVNQIQKMVMENNLIEYVA